MRRERTRGGASHVQVDVNPGGGKVAPGLQLCQVLLQPPTSRVPVKHATLQGRNNEAERIPVPDSPPELLDALLHSVDTHRGLLSLALLVLVVRTVLAAVEDDLVDFGLVEAGHACPKKKRGQMDPDDWRVGITPN